MAEFVTLTANPAVDLATDVERIAPFRKLRCSAAQRDPGGGGINVARALHRWNCDVLAVYPAGGATGDALKQLVKREGVADRVVPVMAETREDFTVFETGTGDQYRFVQPGAPLDEKEWQAFTSLIRAVDPRPNIS